MPRLKAALLALAAVFVDGSADQGRRPVPVRPYHGDSGCEDGAAAGDCNVQHCVQSGAGGACEAHFARFIGFDGRDYSRKTCRCLSESICTLMPPNAHGCVHYMDLSPRTQKLVRLWTMSKAEKLAVKLGGRSRKSSFRSLVKTKSEKQKEVSYSDYSRHNQLVDGQTRFCCRIHRPRRHRAEYLAWTDDSARFAPSASGRLTSTLISGFTALLLLL